MMVAANVTATAKANLFQGLRDAFAPLVTAVKAHIARRETAEKLNGLSDRELDDMGFCRADFDKILGTVR